MAYRTNKAAVYFEQQKYSECIEQCEKAVEVGRENRADFKMIAKALARQANAHMKLGDEKQALHFYDKSLSEHREPSIMSKRNECAKIVAEKERLASIDPVKAQAFKDEGNAHFKTGKYPEALKKYTEAIKFDPENAVLYSNRSACYQKLMEFGLALQDCESCIKKDPKFVKGYTRKGAALYAMREYKRAITSYQDALGIDPVNAEAKQGVAMCRQQLRTDQTPEEARQKAMNDPEIQKILADPVMRMMLEQMQNDPKSINEFVTFSSFIVPHLKNPQVVENMQKLMQAGIIRMG